MTNQFRVDEQMVESVYVRKQELHLAFQDLQRQVWENAVYAT